MKKIFLLFLCATLLYAKPVKKVKTGADILFERRTELIDGKRIGLITNHTAVLSGGKHLADALKDYAAKRHRSHPADNTQLVALFGPEHGIRGDAPDGRTVRDTIDERTGVPVYSLYGRINKPTAAMLKDVDVLVFDIQDVGARFYTFISTMFLGMEAAAENNIPFIVLDRPNPITGRRVEGPVRVDSLKSFVGWAPIPIAHGMTVGELAVMANLQGWLNEGKPAMLTVVKMENWKREQWYDETGLEWRRPSPNMRSLQTAAVYPGLCLIEGVNVSEGRGSDRPFEYIGAPWISGKELAHLLNSQKMAGVKFDPVEFTPKEIPNVASNPKYAGWSCSGVFVNVTNRKKFEPVKTGIAVVWGIHALHADSLTFRERGFDRLAGTPVIREMILQGRSVDDIERTWKEELKGFIQLRKKALLYLE